MRVKELIEKLEALDEDLLVVLSRDAEGNGFEVLGSIESDQKWDQDDRAIWAESLWDNDWGELPGCVVLWP